MKKSFLYIVLTLAVIFSVVQSSLSAYDEIDAIIDNNSNTSAELLQKVTLLTAATIEAEGVNLTILRARGLVDFAGNKYTLVECSPTGYFIFHNRSGQYIEYSFEATSPYSNVSGKLVYGGPTFYYEFNRKGFINTIDNSVLTISGNISEFNEVTQYCNEMDAAMMDCANEKVAAFIGEDTLSSYAQQDDLSSSDAASILSDRMASGQIITTQSTKRTDYWVKFAQFFDIYRVRNFGYTEENGKGLCGYIAANLILQYWDFRNKISLDDKYTNSNGRKNAVLTKELREIGKSLGYGNGTWAYEIKNVMNKFCANYSIPQKATWTVGCLGIPNEIKTNKRPCILFGLLPNADKHAVVVYGYNTYEHKNYYTFVCHYGWDNEGKNYSKIHIYGGLYVTNTQFHL